MKEQSWPTGDEIKASLVDTKGEEMATQELKRASLRTSTLRVGDESLEQSSASSKNRKSWGWSLFSNILM
jgi:hypothetical protein